MDVMARRHRLVPVGGSYDYGELENCTNYTRKVRLGRSKFGEFQIDLVDVSLPYSGEVRHSFVRELSPSDEET